MGDLVRAYFERDLTPEENDRLDALLASSPEEALRYSELAERFYAGLGLPAPDLPGTSGGPGVGWGHAVPLVLRIVIPAALLVGTGILLYSGLTERAAVVRVEPVDATFPKSALQEAPARVAARPEKPKPVPRLKVPAARAPAPSVNDGGTADPIRYDPEAKYGALAVIVNQPQDGILTARVVDGRGTEVRILYAGYLEKGTWVVEWDGNLGKRGTARPGDYVVEVQSGENILKKPVRITAE